MTPIEIKMMKAKAQLILTEPFFASLALNMDYIPDTTIKTACTNGEYIKYNPEFVEKLTMDELKGIICHEVMHPAMHHHTRRGERDQKKWNKACDYAINPLILDSGFVLPEGFLYKEEFRDMPAEQIYNLIPDDEDEDDGSGDGDSDPGGCGGVEDSPAKGEAEKEEKEHEMKENLGQAMNNAKRMGQLPEYLKKLIQQAMEPTIHWQEVLARFLSEISKDDYSYRKPNPRYLQTGFYLPSLYNETVGDIILVVDTSGSTFVEEVLNKFGAEMQDIVNTFGKGFTVIYVDTEVKSTQDIEPDEPFKLQAMGGGGTDFVPAFDWLDEQGIKPKALVYFTDGVCGSFPSTPDYAVLWALQGSYEFDPLFGEVVKIID